MVARNGAVAMQVQLLTSIAVSGGDVRPLGTHLAWKLVLGEGMGCTQGVLSRQKMRCAGMMANNRKREECGRQEEKIGKKKKRERER
jgi:hypothetical protein